MVAVRSSLRASVVGPDGRTGAGGSWNLPTALAEALGAAGNVRDKLRKPNPEIGGNGINGLRCARAGRGGPPAPPPLRIGRPGKGSAQLLASRKMGEVHGHTPAREVRA